GKLNGHHPIFHMKVRKSQPTPEWFGYGGAMVPPLPEHPSAFPRSAAEGFPKGARTTPEQLPNNSRTSLEQLPNNVYLFFRALRRVENNSTAPRIMITSAIRQTAILPCVANRPSTNIKEPTANRASAMVFTANAP